MEFKGSPQRGCLMYLLGLWGLGGAAAAIAFVPTGTLLLAGVLKEMPKFLRISLPGGIATPDWSYLAIGGLGLLSAVSINFIARKPVLGLIGLYLATAGMVIVQFQTGFSVKESMGLFIIWPVIATILLWAPWIREPSGEDNGRYALISQKTPGLVLERMIQDDDFSGLLRIKASSQDEEEKKIVSQALGKLLGPDRIPALNNFLMQTDPLLRREAANLLGEIKDFRAEESLAGLVRDSSPAVRAAAAIGLAQFDNQQGFEDQLKFFGDADGSVRTAAAFAAGHSYNSRAVEPLISLLADPDERVIQEAATALGMIGNRRACKPLQAALERKYQSGAVHPVIASALIDLGA